MSNPDSYRFCNSLLLNFSIKIVLRKGLNVMITTKRKDSKHGTYKLTPDDKRFIQSFSKNGVISFEDYIEALTIILNKPTNTNKQG